MQYSRDLRMGTYYRYRLFTNLGLFEQIRERHKILDIGGFDGFVLHALNSKAGTVIDLDIKAKFTNTGYVKGDFFENKLTSQTFDFIFAFDVLEHIPEGREQEFARKAIKLLKRGGVLYLSTPSNQIHLFPSFITPWVSKKWGHTKCLGYSKKQLIHFIDMPGLKFEITELPARNYLNSYIFLRLIKSFIPAYLMDRALTFVAYRDSQHTHGTTGFYLVKISK